MEPVPRLADLPDDLLYSILLHLPLKSLIAARGVCRAWRHAIEYADIHPIRRSLLDLYLEAINAKWFLESRQWPLKELQSFNRQAYLDTLFGQYNWLPEDFCMWILEWPALATAAWQWPGLPADDFFGFFTIHRRPGINTLGIIPPVIGTVRLTTPTFDESFADHDSDSDSNSEFVDEDYYTYEHVPAVLVWEDPSDYQVWLMLAGKDYQGQVVLTHELTDIYTHYDETDGMFIGDWLSWMRLQHEYLDLVGGYGVSPASMARNPPRKRIKFMPWTELTMDSIAVIVE